MIPPDTDPGFWKSIATFMWMPVGGLVALVWTNLTNRVKRVEDDVDAAVSNDEFDRVRDSIRDIYGKLDANKDLINQKVSDAQRYVSEDVSRLRNEMNGGFERLYKTIVELRKG